MFRNSRKATLFLIGAASCLGGAGSLLTWAQQGKKPFTISDEIGLKHFGDPYAVNVEKARVSPDGNYVAMGRNPHLFYIHCVRITEMFQVSPDGNYVAVFTEDGRLELNRVEDSLRFYGLQDVGNFLMHSEKLQAPAPLWVLNRDEKEGPVIRDWRWLPDSTGVVFVERKAGGKEQLVVADLGKKTVEPLTSNTEEVKEFDVRDRQHYVYAIPDTSEDRKNESDRHGPAIVGTGKNIWELILPDTLWGQSQSAHTTLWAVMSGKPFEVKSDKADLSLIGDELALSPDGRSLVTTLPVSEFPSSWETLYPPPFTSSHDWLRPGKSATQFVRIDLKKGTFQALTDAPTSGAAGWWWGGYDPSWSEDGESILLPGTFIKSKDHTPSRPCVAVVDLTSNNATCVEVLKIRTEEVSNGHAEIHREEGFHTVDNVSFVEGEKQRVAVHFHNHDMSRGTTVYQRTADGAWQVAHQSKSEEESSRDGLEITVKEGLDEPPLLIASNEGTAPQVIWDPNPQLKEMELGKANVYTWKDKEGRELRGGLYRPFNYKPGRRYPLVIQTHGFTESEFRPSGVFPTAFAARALAGVGIMVLQSPDGAEGCNDAVTPEEGLCAVAAYESAARQLVSDGLVDPKKIGIIGFSRSCFYVMEMLTTNSFPVRAASITDGVMLDYFQYMLWPERFLGEGIPMIGAAPFGEGLQQWFKRSPGFNLNKVNTPLMVVGAGSGSLLSMWHPYASLHYQKKPVDLIMLNTEEHVLTNPAVRLASQGGSVDWFRFWLQEYEDPDPAKAEQYKRWRALRKLEESSNKG